MWYSGRVEVNAVTIGQCLRALREQRNKSQREVAFAAGISTTHLSDLENDRKHPSAPMVVRLARALGLEPGHLFEILYGSATLSLTANATQPQSPNRVASSQEAEAA